MAGILLKGSQQKVNEEQAKAIPTEILQGWERLVKEGKALINQRDQMEAYVQDVINRYELAKKGLYIGSIVTGKQIGRASCRERVLRLV